MNRTDRDVTRRRGTYRPLARCRSRVPDGLRRTATKLPLQMLAEGRKPSGIHHWPWTRILFDEPDGSRCHPMTRYLPAACALPLTGTGRLAPYRYKATTTNVSGGRKMLAEGRKPSGIEG